MRSTRTVTRSTLTVWIVRPLLAARGRMKPSPASVTCAGRSPRLTSTVSSRSLRAPDSAGRPRARVTL